MTRRVPGTGLSHHPFSSVGILVGLLVVFAGLPVVAAPWPAETVGTNIASSGSLPGTQEVSGAVWNPVWNRLFVVDDNSGRISCLDRDGGHIESWTVSVTDKDHEAVTFADFASSNVFVGVEQSPAGEVVRKVRKFLLQANHQAALQQEWILTEMNTGAANSGLEGLTFVPDAFLRQFPDTTGAVYNNGRGSRYGSGGLFFASLQDNGVVYVYDLDAAGNTTNKVFVRQFAPVSGRADLADLEFDRTSGLLYCLWDNANKLAAWMLPTVAEPAGHVYMEWDLWSGGGARSDEGIAVANTCGVNGTTQLFVCDDTAENIWRFDQWPCPPVVTIAATDAHASETNVADTAQFTVTRSGPTTTALSTDYTITGSASDGVDYAALSKTISLPAGATQAVITVTPIPDLLAEGDENVVLTLSTPVACVLGDPGSASAMIHDKPFDAWRAAHFTTGELGDPLISGPEADPDHDGLANLMEYAFALVPQEASVLSWSTPQIVANFLTLSYTRPQPPPPDVRYEGETSAILPGAWTADAVELAVTTNSNGTATVTIRDSVSIATAPQHFLRLRIRLQP